MSSKTEIRRISADQTHSLRHSVLRPHQEAAQLVYPGDDDETTFHLGAFLDGELVGVASIYREAREGGDGLLEWRLRGMATAKSARRHGIGRKLLETCTQQIRSTGGILLWCKARASAREFYLDSALEAVGEEFELPDIGTHVIMQRSLT